MSVRQYRGAIVEPVHPYGPRVARRGSPASPHTGSDGDGRIQPGALAIDPAHKVSITRPDQTL